MPSFKLPIVSKLIGNRDSRMVEAATNQMRIESRKREDILKDDFMKMLSGNAVDITTPDLRELANHGQSWMMKTGVQWLGAYNPDSIALETYQKMRWDGQIKLGLSVIKLPIQSRDFSVECEDNDIAAFIDKALRLIWKGWLKSILTSQDFGFCLPYDVWLDTNEGKIQIGKIVNEKKKVMVKTFNQKTQRVEYRKIVNWMSRKCTDSLVDIHFGRKTKRTLIRCTKEHPILTEDGWKKAEDITLHDKVMVESYVLSKTQKEFLYGSLLGDSSLGSCPNGWRSYWTVTHSEKQKDYLEWIKCLMASIKPKEATFTHTSPHYSDRKYRYFSLTTQEIPSLVEIKNVVFRGEVKTITMEWLNKLDRLGLAAWFMDDGSCRYAKAMSAPYVILCTDAYPKEECEIIVKWFKEKWGINTFIRCVSARQGKVPNKEAFRVVVGRKEESEKFLNLISPFVRIDSKGKHWIAEKIFTEPIKGIVPIPVVSISDYDIYKRKQCRYMTVFDIEVEGTHNFMVNSAVVHNSAHEKIWEQKPGWHVVDADRGVDIVVNAYVYRKMKDLLPTSITVDYKKDTQEFNGFIQNKGGQDEVPVPTEKSFVYTHDKEFGNVYGWSRMKAVYPYWYTYWIVDGLHERWLSKLGREPIVVEYPPGTSPDGFETDGVTVHYEDNAVFAQRAGESVQPDSVIKVPAASKDEPGWDIKALEVRSRGEQFERYKEFLDIRKLRALLVPERMVTQHGGTGTEAMAKVHADVGVRSIEGEIQDIEDHINKYAIPQLIKYTFGDNAPEAIVKIEELSQETKAFLSDVYMQMVKTGKAQPAIDKIEDYLGIPRMPEEEKEKVDDGLPDPEEKIENVPVGASEKRMYGATLRFQNRVAKILGE